MTSALGIRACTRSSVSLGRNLAAGTLHVYIIFHIDAVTAAAHTHELQQYLVVSPLPRWIDTARPATSNPVTVRSGHIAKCACVHAQPTHSALLLIAINHVEIRSSISSYLSFYTLVFISLTHSLRRLSLTLFRSFAPSAC